MSSISFYEQQKAEWKEMSQPVSTRTLVDTFCKLKDSEAKIFMVLWFFMDYCNPFLSLDDQMIEDIAKNAGYKVSTIQRCIRNLYKCKLLVKDGKDTYIDPAVAFPGYPEDAADYLNSGLSPKAYLEYRKSTDKYLYLEDK